MKFAEISAIEDNSFVLQNSNTNIVDETNKFWGKYIPINLVQT